MGISAANIEWREDGTPYAPDFGDIYHSAAGALAQARHVFLGGNGLPERWHGRERFVIVETGFGLGSNFLATWAAWRDDPSRCERLFFASIEKHPPRTGDLRRMHDATPLRALGETLAAAWPAPTPGLHALRFEQGRVVLLLGLGDVEQVLPELALQADAFYLDGFAPAKNPVMWSPRVTRALARLARPQATLATYSAARPVRDALTEAGFAADLAPGFAGKREMTVARFARPRRTRHVPASPLPERAPASAIVVGGGVAGCAGAHALAERGVDVVLLERNAALAQETSGNRMGGLQPLLARDDNLGARFTRAGFLDAIARIRTAQSADPGCAELTGALHLAMDATEEAEMAQTLAASELAPDYVRQVTRAEAAALAGVEVSHGGWWFAQAGWVRPARYGAALVAARSERIAVRTQAAVARIERVGEIWRALDADGHALAEAPALVVAAAHATPLLLELEIELQRLRGQVSELPASSLKPPRVPVAGDGYVLPEGEGICVVGATYEFDDPGTLQPLRSAHLENLDRLARLLAGQRANVEIDRLAGRVGWRAVAHDRMPLAGLVHDGAKLAAYGAAHAPHLDELARAPGLGCVTALASRGIAWAGLCGALVTAQLCGDPLPVERTLRDAVDPARFALRRLRRDQNRKPILTP